MRWVFVIVVSVACGWFLHWNEFDSPWGRDVQAAKAEILKSQLCR